MFEIIKGAWCLATKDLRIELRGWRVLTSSLLFSSLVIVLASIAFVDGGSNAAAGIFWVANLFSGIVVLSHVWSTEREGRVFDALLVSPLPRASIFFGKAIACTALMIVVNLVIAPLTGVFFGLAPLNVWKILVMVMPLATLGFMLAGSLFATLTVQTRARDAALSVAVFPLIVPVLLSAVVATRQLLVGDEEIGVWLILLAIFVFVFSALGAFLFELLASD